MKVATFLGRSAALAALVLAPAAATAADLKLESMQGDSAKRVILSPKAAERLGIALGEVGEEPIVRKQVVGGLVIAPLQKLPEPPPANRGFGGFGLSAAAPELQPVAARQPGPAGASTGGTRLPGPAANEAWLLVTLSPAEWERLAKDKPARVLPLATREGIGKEVWARPSGMLPYEDAKRSMLALYYVVPGTDHGLIANKRMRVELQLSGSDEKHKVVPYGAVYYDAKGAAWIYVNTTPLVFERRRIQLERIVGELAVVSDGPPVGTPVVTVGAAILYGAELFGR
jgi:multidrug efflux pump subunit AcrA (membrane-fusion protein)